MHIFRTEEVSQRHLEGRILQNLVGSNAFSDSNKMTVTYAIYSRASGPMKPHRHAEETVYILRADKGFFLYGRAEDDLSERVELGGGMVLHVDEDEWHVFQYQDDGVIEALCIYGQTDNLRPEGK